VKLGVAAMGLAACAPASGPTVDRVEPAQAARGAMVTVRGAGFCGEGRLGAAGACTTLPPGAVDFGIDPPMVRATVLAWADAAIAVTVPTSVMTGGTDVLVTVDGRTSNAATFEVLP